MPPIPKETLQEWRSRLESPDEETIHALLRSGFVFDLMDEVEQLGRLLNSTTEIVDRYHRFYLKVRDALGGLLREEVRVNGVWETALVISRSKILEVYESLFDHDFDH